LPETPPLYTFVVGESLVTEAVLYVRTALADDSLSKRRSSKIGGLSAFDTPRRASAAGRFIPINLGPMVEAWARKAGKKENLPITRMLLMNKDA
jgi:hypothetical protein